MNTLKQLGGTVVLVVVVWGQAVSGYFSARRGVARRQVAALSQAG